MKKKRLSDSNQEICDVKKKKRLYKPMQARRGLEEGKITLRTLKNTLPCIVRPAKTRHTA